MNPPRLTDSRLRRNDETHGRAGKMMGSRTRGSEQYVLALDMGSGSVKSALVSRGGELAGTGFEAIETILLPGGGAEQDPDRWWTAAIGAARAALAEGAVPPEQVRAVACTTAWSITVPVDAEGSPLANALTWMDTRGGPYNRAWCAGSRGLPATRRPNCGNGSSSPASRRSTPASTASVTSSSSSTSAPRSTAALTDFSSRWTI